VFILFVDTQSRFRNKGLVAEDVLSSPEVPDGKGYAGSKRIADCILDAAGERTPLRPVLARLRLGRVCGEGNSIWNEEVWSPSPVKSGLALNSLPRLDGVSGIPITLTALLLIRRLDCLVD